MPVRNPAAVEKNTFLEAMSSLAGAVHVVATIEDGEPVGVVATSVCSLSADPPSLVVCLNRSTSAHDPILRRRRFSVFILEAGQGEVARRFMTQKGAARFDHESWQAVPGEVPHLKGAVARFDCELDDICDGYSHSILIGRIAAMEHEPSGATESLLWHKRGFARPASVEVAASA